VTKIKRRQYSVYSRKAAILLGKMIRLGRTERKLSAQDITDRAGISRTTLWKIESGDMKCEIGIVFEVAALVGVKLFETDTTTIGSLNERIEDKIALLPKSIRTSKKDVKDDF
jgi:transcriptional regulator with XRE-family HTH domain